MSRECSTHEAKLNVYRILWESQKEINHYEEEDAGGWIILRWILES
jgi:hypothetical protein